MPALILTRKIGERVELAEGEIIVTVMRASARQVKLKFEAPIDIPIFRGEVVDANKKGDLDGSVSNAQA